MGLNIKSIAFTAYPVTDVSRSRKFYGEILGLKETMALDFGGGKWWVEYDIGEGTFAITNVHAPSPNGAGPNVAFEVEDLDAAIATLKAKGISLAEGGHGAAVTESPFCRFCFIRDPDETAIILHQLKPKSK